MQNVYLNIFFLLISSLGVDDAREDDARFGTRGRSLLQNMTDEEIISMSLSGCDPSQGTGACGPSFQGECVDDLPSNITLECSDYVRLDLCGQIDEEFCKVSCDRCPEEAATVDDAMKSLQIMTIKTLWDGQDYCSSEFVTCDGNKIIVIDLLKDGLKGTIPKEISVLTALTYLRFGLNQIEGTIPAEISVLTALTYLDLGSNSIEGTLPPQLSTLEKLMSFSVFDNWITGTLPAEYSTMELLEWFSVGANSLQGTLPAEYSTMELLEWFDAYFNSLQGTLPAEYSTMELLERFDARSNSLQGTVPLFFTQISKLYLQYNPLLCVVDQGKYPGLSVDEVLPCN